MKRGNWRDRGRDRRRHGYRSDWQRDSARHRTLSQEQRYGSSETRPSYRDRTPESRPRLDTAAPTPSSSSSSSIPELPGFYFDAEKNRYFRLLPGHNNCNPLTRELLQEREQEKHRARMLTEDEQPRKKAPRAGLNTALLLQKRHLGLLPGNSYCRLIHEVKVSGMKRHKLEVQSSDTSSPNTDNFRLIVGDSACERVFTVNDVSHGGCKYGIMNFRGCSRGSLSVEMCDNLYFTNRKVNSICWASVTHHDSHVLLCLVGMAETPGCVSLLPASLFSNSNPDQPGMLCSFKISTAWSCAWCLNPQADKTFSTGPFHTFLEMHAVHFRFRHRTLYRTEALVEDRGVLVTALGRCSTQRDLDLIPSPLVFFASGLSRRVIVTDAVTGRRQTYGVGSDVLAQQFALRAPVLFNGCRSGEVFSIDLRQKGRKDHSWKACRFDHDSAITSVRILQDENYLLAADMLGQIKLWDVRVTKPVQQFKGHHNEHAYLPLHVNEAEGLLMAVGQDCYTRIWSLGDGQLLRTIPSPHPAGKDLIPSVVFSSQLGGQRGLPGLLMAVRRDLYYFPYNADYQEGGVVAEVACQRTA